MNHDTHEDRDPLWTVLGKARPVKVSPRFTQDVLRRVRMEQAAPEPGFFEWLRTGWNWAGLAGAAAAVALVVFSTQGGAPGDARLATGSAGDAEEIDEVVRSADFAVIANLDVLLALDENDLWLDASVQ